MAEQDAPPRVDPYQVAEIVGSYVRHHQIEPDELIGLIVEVHRALASLGRASAVQASAKPAVPIRRSVQQDYYYIVCLECGFRAQMLRRHLRVAHGLDVTAYRARWRLPADYPVTAPSYSARRTRMAKEIGLGRRAATEPSLPATGRPVTRSPAEAPAVDINSLVLPAVRRRAVTAFKLICAGKRGQGSERSLRYFVALEEARLRLPLAYTVMGRGTKDPRYRGMLPC
jgi:predicted transcriptional regulator